MNKDKQPGGPCGRLFGSQLLALTLLPGVLRAAEAEPAPAARVRPNIVLINTDDLGYGDPSCYGNEEFQTPAIDSLARTGVRFTAGYATGCVCSPSRAGLVTGAVQARFGVLMNGDRYAVPEGQVLMSEALRKAGYHTAMLGKWNIAANRPASGSFDEVFSVMDWGGDYFPYEPGTYSMVDGDDDLDFYYTRIYPGWGPVDGKVHGEYLTDRMGRQAVEYIDSRAGTDQPFFIYLSFNAPHSAWQAPEEYRERFPHLETEADRVYAAMVTAVDENIARVLEALERHGLRQNTLIAFTSDNGQSHGERGSRWGNWRDDWPALHQMGSAGPLRGGKGTMWEGGIRVPFILSWPGVLPEGVVNDTPVSSLDFLPTFCAAAGISLPETGIYDGTNLLPYLTHEDRSPGRKIIWFARGRYIVREGDWKLLPSASSQCNTGYWMAGGGSSCWWL